MVSSRRKSSSLENYTFLDQRTWFELSDICYFVSLLLAQLIVMGVTAKVLVLISQSWSMNSVSRKGVLRQGRGD